MDQRLSLNNPLNQNEVKMSQKFDLRKRNLSKYIHWATVASWAAAIAWSIAKTFCSISCRSWKCIVVFVRSLPLISANDKNGSNVKLNSEIRLEIIYPFELFESYFGIAPHIDITMTRMPKIALIFKKFWFIFSVSVSLSFRHKENNKNTEIFNWKSGVEVIHEPSLLQMHRFHCWCDDFIWNLCHSQETLNKRPNFFGITCAKHIANLVIVVFNFALGCCHRRWHRCRCRFRCLFDDCFAMREIIMFTMRPNEFLEKCVSLFSCRFFCSGLLRFTANSNSASCELSRVNATRSGNSIQFRHDNAMNIFTFERFHATGTDAHRRALPPDRHKVKQLSRRIQINVNHAKWFFLSCKNLQKKNETLSNMTKTQIFTSVFLSTNFDCIIRRFDHWYDDTYFQWHISCMTMFTKCCFECK